MEKYIEFKLEDGQAITIQTNTSESGYEYASDKGVMVGKATQTLSEALMPLKATSENIFKVFDGSLQSPDEVQVELSVKISAKAGVIITSGEVEGNFKVTLKWTKKK